MGKLLKACVSIVIVGLNPINIAFANEVCIEPFLNGSCSEFIGNSGEGGRSFSTAAPSSVPGTSAPLRSAASGSTFGSSSFADGIFANTILANGTFAIGGGSVGTGATTGGASGNGGTSKGGGGSGGNCICIATDSQGYCLFYEGC